MVAPLTVTLRLSFFGIRGVSTPPSPSSVSRSKHPGENALAGTAADHGTCDCDKSDGQCSSIFPSRRAKAVAAMEGLELVDTGEKSGRDRYVPSCTPRRLLSSGAFEIATKLFAHSILTARSTGRSLRALSSAAAACEARPKMPASWMLIGLPSCPRLPSSRQVPLSG